MTSVLNYDKIDLSGDKIKFTKPEKQKNIYYSSISYDNKPLFIQTSKVKLLSDTQNLSKEPSLLFQIGNNNLDFYDFFIKLDDKLIKETYNNGKDWFNKEIPLDVIDDMYKRTAKPIAKNNSPSIRFKLPTIQNKIVSKIYNQSKEFINVDNIAPDTESILIIHIRGIKFMKQQYICDIYISQLKAFIPRENKYLVSEVCLIEENNNEANESDEDILDDEVFHKIKLEEEQIIKENKLKIQKMEELERQLKLLRCDIEELDVK
jgi:hypothetical protein